MALYLVVPHRLAEPKLSEPVWEEDDDHILKSIMTPPQVGDLCRKAMERGEAIYIHRAYWKRYNSIVCCGVRVVEVIPMGDMLKVRFAAHVPLNRLPFVVPADGQWFYEGPPP